MELRQQLLFLRSSLRWIIAGTIIAAVVALAVSLALPKSYESQVVLLVGESGGTSSAGDLNALQVSQRLSQTYAKIAVSRQVANNVIAALGLDTDFEELLEHVRAEAPIDSTLLTISVDDPDPAQATRIANAFATDMIENPITRSGQFTAVQALVDQEMASVRAEIENAEAQVAQLQGIDDPTAAELGRLGAVQAQMATLRQTFATLLGLTAGGPPNQLSIADPALAPLAPTSPQLLLNVVLGALLGLIIGIGAAYTMRRLDDTVRTPEDLAAAAGVPVLGTIMEMPGDDRRPLYYRLAALLYPRSPATEGFRHIRTAIEFTSPETPFRTLLVTSPMPGDGKTTFAANLAVVYAQAGKRVCLLDADLRKPAVHVMFQVPNSIGLTDLLHDQSRASSTTIQATEVEGLSVITSGPLPPGPAEQVASARMRVVLDELLERFDLVILDSPPLQAVTDAAVLSSIADGTLLVSASRKTRRQAIVRASATLQRVGARVVGAALNGATTRDGEEASVWFYGYYTATPGGDPAAPKPPASSPAMSRADGWSTRRADPVKEPRTSDS